MKNLLKKLTPIGLVLDLTQGVVDIFSNPKIASKNRDSKSSRAAPATAFGVGCVAYAVASPEQKELITAFSTIVTYLVLHFYRKG